MSRATGVWRTLSRRWPQYVAEIVVIVFSVLAAFALDSWKNERSRASEEVAILRSCLAGMESDLKDIDYNVKLHREAIASMELLLERLASDAPYHDSLAAHFHNALVMPRFVHATTAFETIQSRGVDIITNEALRNQLIRVYEAAYDNYLAAESEQAGEVAYGLRTIMPTRFVEGYRYDRIGESYSGSMVPLDFSRLKRDQEYLYYLRTLKNRTNVFVGFQYRFLRRDVEQTIALLSEEIRRRTS